MPSDTFKSCPECAEDIKRAALVCRFCGYRFVAQPRVSQGDLRNDSPPVEPVGVQLIEPPPTPGRASRRGLTTKLAVATALTVTALAGVIVATRASSSPLKPKEAARGTTTTATSVLSVAAARTVGAALRDIADYCGAADRVSSVGLKQGVKVLPQQVLLGVRLPTDVDQLIAVYRGNPGALYLDSRGARRTMRQVLADAAGDLDPTSCSDASAAWLAELHIQTGTDVPPPGQALPPAKHAAELQARLKTELQATP